MSSAIIAAFLLVVANAAGNDSEDVSFETTIKALDVAFPQRKADIWAKVSEEDVVELLDLGRADSPTRQYFADQGISDLRWITRAVFEAWSFSERPDPKSILAKYGAIQKRWEQWLLELERKRKVLTNNVEVGSEVLDALRAVESPHTQLDDRCRVFHNRHTVDEFEVKDADFRTAIEAWVYMQDKAASLEESDPMKIPSVSVTGHFVQADMGSESTLKTVRLSEVAIIDVLSTICEEYGYYFVYTPGRVEIGRDVRFLPKELFSEAVIANDSKEEK